VVPEIARTILHPREVYTYIYEWENRKKHKTTSIQKRDPKKFFDIDKLRGFTHRCTSGSVPNLPYTAMLGVYLVISPTFSFSQEV